MANANSKQITTLKYYEYYYSYSCYLNIQYKVIIKLSVCIACYSGLNDWRCVSRNAQLKGGQNCHIDLLATQYSVISLEVVISMIGSSQRKLTALS